MELAGQSTVVGNYGLQRGECLLCDDRYLKGIKADDLGQGCDWQACPYKTLAPGEHFG